MKNNEYFEGCAVGGSDPRIEIWQSGPIFLVTHRFRSLLRTWRIHGYHNAKAWEAAILASPSVIKPMGEERYPRDYPLEIDWTRV